MHNNKIHAHSKYVNVANTHNGCKEGRGRGERGEGGSEEGEGVRGEKGRGE